MKLRTVFTFALLISTSLLIARPAVGEALVTENRYFVATRGRANASKLLLSTTKVKNQRKNQYFAFDYFLCLKAIA
ncbi:hypothetical protein FNW02_28875 [Komarekiella sp. 'clone 1']|uniref:Uncharacterized protein n=1 Tax=Komarekiella delphini-convector SJRDD-AB1 TaxID=2593771 RepID=A0AA40T2Y2_9NOST|nr:hypothetical protein [Komarekiella delphini-convector]MBD6619720.1 hypothetical protein [Komarekiella delphini-convector SJRDD-AB1]